MPGDLAGADPWRYRCPECGSTTIRVKGGGFSGERERAEAYRCGACNHHFDEPRDMKHDAATAD